MVEQAASAISRKWRKPKQARSLERVNRILDVAEVIFIEQGYAAATTKEIAAVAEVPIGTLYQFFPDKEAILQALAERYSDLLDQQVLCCCSERSQHWLCPGLIVVMESPVVHIHQVFDQK